jgi:hypothetical protein
VTKWYVQILSAASRVCKEFLVAYVKILGICWEVMLNPQLQREKKEYVSRVSKQECQMEQNLSSQSK